MTAIPRALEMVTKLVPDLPNRIGRFEVETFELDEELMEAFREELDRLTSEIRTARQGDDPEILRKAVHSMKGMCGAIGLPEISVLAQEIEFMIRAENMERADELIAPLLDWATGFLEG